MKTITKLWIGIGLLIILSPLGLVLPERFKAGAAWGEWTIAQVQEVTGYIPKGLAKLSGLWRAPISDYKFQGWEGNGLSHLSFAYIISGIIGVATVLIAVYVLARLLIKKNEK